MRYFSAVLLGCAVSVSALDALAQPRARIDVPVMVGGTGVLDGCASVGQIIGLDPRGDGFLSVRSGPGGKPYREIDRLYNGNQVFVCHDKGPWLAVVYGQSADGTCGVSTPWPVRQPYTGPCRSGWIHSRYVQIVAG
ncbi:integron [Microvirga aerophila]|uniref:Integron n=1 Tax=Microvirga aerophila TaxID=670291 RepID=A0A512BPT4_9HYPH|nr:integron [Microvirga aerophila]GEO13953.1 hypothetical protein MAE02_16490 [Microvirga aerophila]